VGQKIVSFSDAWVEYERGGLRLLSAGIEKGLITTQRKKERADTLSIPPAKGE